MEKLPSKIFQEILTENEIGFHYGEKWKQSFNSTHASYPAIFMDSIKHVPSGIGDNEDYINLEFAFIVADKIDIEKYANPDFAIFHLYQWNAIILGLKFLRWIRDYENSKGIPIFNTDTNYEVQYFEGLPLRLFDDLVEGSVFSCKIKMLNTDKIC